MTTDAAYDWLRCPMCGGAGGHEWPTSGWRPAVGRTCCRLLLCQPPMTRADYEQQYWSLQYHRDACLAAGRRPLYDRFAEHLATAECRLADLRARLALPAGAAVLDVGAGNGAFVYAARRAGLYAAGLEPSAPMCRMARRRGAPLAAGDWHDMAGHWSLVTAIDVIEHLTDPVGFLTRAGRHTRALYLETPDWHVHRPAAWRHIKPREHPVLYSWPALRHLARACGWRVRDHWHPVDGKMAVLLSAASRR